MRVAQLLGLKPSDVSLVTTAFLEAARNELVRLVPVRLDGFGELKVVPREGRVDMLLPQAGPPVTAKRKKKYHVVFKKAAPFARVLREKFGDAQEEADMNKYGVDEQGAADEKKASEGCPECGAKAERHGSVLACPTHGTEPFETKSK
jgi:nucleoid DNA-binding protein